MSLEHVNNKMDECYDMIESGYYVEAVHRLKLLKIRFPEDIVKDVNSWEKEHDETLNNRIKTIKESKAQPIVMEHEIKKQENMYALEYYKYYNKIRKEYDID